MEVYERRMAAPIQAFCQGWMKCQCNLFFWVPAALQYSIFATPFILSVVCFYCFGEAITIVHSIGTILYLVCSITFPGEKKIKGYPTMIRSDTKTGIVKKNVAIIGAGPSGLVTAKELIEAGHRVSLYDCTPRVGGEFNNRFYPGGRLTSSPYVTAFSDFEPEGSKQGQGVQGSYYHHTKDEYGQYLQDYCNHFGVSSSLRMNTTVRSVYKENYDTNSAQSQFFLEVEESKNQGVGLVGINIAKRRDGPFHHVAVCIGRHRMPTNPIVNGLSSFDGTIYHSSDFCKKDLHNIDRGYSALAGKRVLTIGLGEALGDMLQIISMRMKNPPKKICASTRSGVFVIPRINTDTGLNNDFDSTRLRYAMPKYIHNLTLLAKYKISRYFSFQISPAKKHFYNLFDKLPYPAYVRATKSDEFLKGVCAGKIAMKPGIDRIDGRTCYFKDGSQMRNIDAIIFGTGYDVTDKNYPFFSTLKSVPENKPPISCPSCRFFRIFDPQYRDSIAFIGIGVRPLIGSIPTSAELQARLFAMVVSGERKLPDTRKMKEHITSETKMYERTMSFANESWRGLIDWIPFMDSIAYEIGCLPRTRTWFFTRPLLWLKLLMGPMTAYHYRLVGPGSDRGKAEDAERIIHKLPLGTTMKDTALYMGIHGIIASLCWPVLVINLLYDCIVLPSVQCIYAHLEETADPFGKVHKHD